MFEQQMIVASVEDMWCAFHHITSPINLSIGASYRIFQHGIFPAWEDPANEFGGRILLNFSSEEDSKVLDDVWVYALAYSIGGNSSNVPMNGVVVSNKKRGKRIEFWLKETPGPVEMVKSLVLCTLCTPGYSHVRCYLP